mmetsp:Transcript_3804/g.8965  ORF Transcript_3804/g.8965 Transcript_3804/m.8965 type:complete len:228 (-) Transcript_3804:1921-2604(-)
MALKVLVPWYEKVKTAVPGVSLAVTVTVCDSVVVPAANVRLLAPVMGIEVGALTTTVVSAVGELPRVTVNVVVWPAKTTGRAGMAMAEAASTIANSMGDPLGLRGGRYPAAAVPVNSNEVVMKAAVDAGIESVALVAPASAVDVTVVIVSSPSVDKDMRVVVMVRFWLVGTAVPSLKYKVAAALLVRADGRAPAASTRVTWLAADTVMLAFMGLGSLYWRAPGPRNS